MPHNILVYYSIYYCAASIVPAHTSATSPAAIMLCSLCHVSHRHHCNQHLHHPGRSEIRITLQRSPSQPTPPLYPVLNAQKRHHLRVSPKPELFWSNIKRQVWMGGVPPFSWFELKSFPCQQTNPVSNMQSSKQLVFLDRLCITCIGNSRAFVNIKAYGAANAFLLMLTLYVLSLWQRYLVYW